MGIPTEVRRSSHLSASQLCHETEEPVAVLAVPSGLILDANEAFCRLFQVNSVEDWTEPILSCAGKGTRRLLCDLLETWQGYKDQWVPRACFFRLDGRRLQGRTGLLPVPGARKRIALLHILRGGRTGKMELRTLIDQRLEQLRSLEHLRALGEFSSLMVHEIRTPLTSLHIGLDLLQKDPAFDSRFDRKVGVLIEQVTRIDTFLRHVRDFAKPVVLFPTFLSTRSLIGSVVGEMKERFPSLSIQIQFRTGRVYADPERLREVLNNILVNAAEAVEGVGEISIRVSSIREGVRFSVKDRGVGMNFREQKNAFQLFHTTKREGTGLGLPIVKKIMDLHGGRVSLVSVLGRGTEVRLDFPTGEESRCVS